MTENRGTALDLLHNFNRVLGVDFAAPADLLQAAQAALDGCQEWPMHSELDRETRLIALINAKLKLNKDRYQEFLDYAAKERIFFNYHDKAEILECLNYSDTSRLENWLDQRGLRHLATRLTPITLAESLAGLRTLLRTGTVNRSDARQCPLLERQTAILRSLFGSYIFYSFPAQAMHSHFNEHCRSDYRSEFYDHLLQRHSTVLRRDCALVFLQIDREL